MRRQYEGVLARGQVTPDGWRLVRGSGDFLSSGPVHKVAFQIGSFTIYWYGVMMALAFVVGLWTASRRAVRYGLPPERIVDLGPWLIVGGLVGARLLYVVSYWKESFAGRPFLEVLNIRNGGLVYYGGLIGAVAAGLGYLAWKRMPLWKTADALAPSVALGYVFGRTGCLLNGCCYGRPTHLPWAIHFPPEHSTHGVGVHPTQVYDGLLALGLYAFLAWLYRRKRFDGQVFACYLISYALTRSFVELFRGDYPPEQYVAGWITPAHWVSAVMLVAGVVLYRVLQRRSQSNARKTS